MSPAATEGGAPPAPATPPPPPGLPALELLGDGTAVLRDDHHVVRLSANRERWWNGRLWLPTAESTPPGVHYNEDGRCWWDGVEWRPRGKTVPWWRKPLLAQALAITGLPLLVLLVVGALPGTVALGLIVVLFFPGVWLTATATFIPPREKWLLLLSVLGLAIIALLRSLERRQGAGPAAHESGAARLRA